MSPKGIIPRSARAGLLAATLLLGGCIGAALLTGCVVVPMPGIKRGRPGINERTAATIPPGTPAGEVFARFGEPDVRSADGRRVEYHFSRLWGVFVVGLTGPIGGGFTDVEPVIHEDAIVIEFDAENRVAKAERVKLGNVPMFADLDIAPQTEWDRRFAGWLKGSKAQSSPYDGPSWDCCWWVGERIWVLPQGTDARWADAALRAHRAFRSGKGEGGALWIDEGALTFGSNEDSDARTGGTTAVPLETLVAIVRLDRGGSAEQLVLLNREGAVFGVSSLGYGGRRSPQWDPFRDLPRLRNRGSRNDAHPASAAAVVDVWTNLKIQVRGPARAAGRIPKSGGGTLCAEPAGLTFRFQNGESGDVLLGWGDLVEVEERGGFGHAPAVCLHLRDGTELALSVGRGVPRSVLAALARRLREQDETGASGSGATPTQVAGVPGAPSRKRPRGSVGERRSRRMRAIRWGPGLLLVAGTLLLGGCVGALPLPGIKTGRAVDERTAAQIAPGTNYADVILRYGEPDLVSPERRVIAYRYSRIWGAAWAMAAPPAGGALLGGALPFIYEEALVVTFDEHGRVVRAERCKGGWNDTSFVELQSMLPAAAPDAPEAEPDPDLPVGVHAGLKRPVPLWSASGGQGTGSSGWLAWARDAVRQSTVLDAEDGVVDLVNGVLRFLPHRDEGGTVGPSTVALDAVRLVVRRHRPVQQELVLVTKEGVVCGIVVPLDCDPLLVRVAASCRDQGAVVVDLWEELRIELVRGWFTGEWPRSGWGRLWSHPEGLRFEFSRGGGGVPDVPVDWAEIEAIRIPTAFGLPYMVRLHRTGGAMIWLSYKASQPEYVRHLGSQLGRCQIESVSWRDAAVTAGRRAGQ